MYLLDTYSLLWWTLDFHKLSDLAKQTLNSVDDEEISISSISLWEIGAKVLRKRIDLGVPLTDYYQTLTESNINILAVDQYVWIKNVFLNWEHKDPADRTIVATGMVHDLQIVTKDEDIRKFYKNCLW